MIRATTGGVMKTYRRNLMNSFIGQNKALNTVLTQRTFNSYAEDPASAAKAFRLRKSRMTVAAQHDVCTSTLKKYQTAFTSLDSIDELIDTENGKGTALTTLKGTSLQMLNDPDGSARSQMAKALDQLAQSIIQNMNQKYGDNFIFAGADGQNVPFEIKTQNGVNRLYYRGVPVDAHEPNVWKDSTGSPFKINDNGEYDLNGTNYLKMDNARVISQEEYDALCVEPIAETATQTLGDGSTITVNVEYNADGTIKQEGQSGGYYKLQNDAACGAAGDLVSIDDFLSAQSQAAAPPTVLQSAGGGNLNVDADGQPMGAANPDPAQNYYIVVDGNPKNELINQSDYNTAKSDADKLAFLADEKLFVDIGLGFQENENGQLKPSSAFDASLNGIVFLGYGLDEDGDPKNIYSLVQRMKEINDSVPEGGSWDQVWDEFDRLVGKLETASSSFKTEFVNMDATTTKLENNEQLLTVNYDNLREQYSALEDVDMADAISAFLWAQYSYNAALKMGNSVLGQSLMDYLN